MENLAQKLKAKDEELQKARQEIEFFDKIHQNLQEKLNKESRRREFLEKQLRNQQICAKTESFFKENELNAQNCEETAEKTERLRKNVKTTLKPGKSTAQIHEIKSILLIFPIIFLLFPIIFLFFPLNS